MTHDILGIDVGQSYTAPTTGICRAGPVFALGTAYADYASRSAAAKISLADRLDMLALDGPLPRDLSADCDVRACEKVLLWGAFQKRCKPGESGGRAGPRGQALRRAACDTARQFQSLTKGDSPARFPRVLEQRTIVEAFPNAYLAVLLDESAFSVERSDDHDKSDLYYEAACSTGSLTTIAADLSFGRRAFTSVRDHDERAALVCALTALGVVHNSYVAVGAPATGWIFLPTWSRWKDWARRQLIENRRRWKKEHDDSLEVWINGDRFTGDMSLPE